MLVKTEPTTADVCGWIVDEIGRFSLQFTAQNHNGVLVLRVDTHGRVLPAGQAMIIDDTGWMIIHAMDTVEALWRVDFDLRRPIDYRKLFWGSLVCA